MRACHRWLLNRTSSFLLLACSLGVGGSAVAQPNPASAPAAPPAVVTPPKIIEEVPPRYPEGQEGDHSVVVELVVLENGTPTEVHIVDGSEPFASAAIEAVKASRFSPATREAPSESKHALRASSVVARHTRTRRSY